MTESHIRNVIEAAMLAAGKPLQAAELVDLFDEGAERPTLAGVQAALAALTEEYSTRGIEIKETAAGFRIQVRVGLSNEISRLWPERPPKYSRALLETLAIIAYRQPITRAEIEAVRGVAVNPNIVKTVIERNWVHVVGHRDVPGRPELLGTTRDFLDYFGLKRLDELPPLAEVKAIGEIKVQFDLPDPGPLALASDGEGAANAPAAAGEPATAAGEAANAESPNADGATADRATTDAASAHAAAANAEAAANTHGSPETAGTDDAATHAVSGDASDTDHAATHAVSAAVTNTAAADDAAHAVDTESAGTDAVDDVEANGGATAATGESAAPQPNEGASKKAAPSAGRGSGRKKKRGKSTASDSALHEAEEFAASVDADLAGGDDDSSDEDELSAAGPDSSELVAGPRDIDD